MDARSKEIRKLILNVSYKSGHGHIPTCFSVVEMLRAVYETMRHDPKNPSWPERDLFILSKGHASLAHYMVLAEQGYFSPDAVAGFGSAGSTFGCHADRHKVPGIEASTGSLGHGIGLAAGMALGLKIQKSQRRVFVLIGDGEANEGTVWEAAMVARSRGLGNLTVIYDDNRSHGRGLQIIRPAEKFRAFGFDVEELDGHDMNALKQALSKTGGEKPRAIIASAVKGYGCKTLTGDQYAWHRRSPKADELDVLLREIDETTV